MRSWNGALPSTHIPPNLGAYLFGGGRKSVLVLSYLAYNEGPPSITFPVLSPAGSASAPSPLSTSLNKLRYCLASPRVPPRLILHYASLVPDPWTFQQMRCIWCRPPITHTQLASSALPIVYLYHLCRPRSVLCTQPLSAPSCSILRLPRLEVY